MGIAGFIELLSLLLKDIKFVTKYTTVKIIIIVRIIAKIIIVICALVIFFCKKYNYLYTK